MQNVKIVLVTLIVSVTTDMKETENFAMITMNANWNHVKLMRIVLTGEIFLIGTFSLLIKFNSFLNIRKHLQYTFKCDTAR
jgi:hypothetical protein